MTDVCSQCHYTVSQTRVCMCSGEEFLVLGSCVAERMSRFVQRVASLVLLAHAIHGEHQYQYDQQQYQHRSTDDSCNHQSVAITFRCQSVTTNYRQFTAIIQETCIASGTKRHWQKIPSCLAHSFTFPRSFLCLQCFDAVGWASGRASGL